MKPILVTGGAGYIGSHACKALARSGYQPVVYDNLSRGHEWAVKWGPFERGAIEDAERLREVLRRHRPAAVMHFAAFAYAGESVTDPALYYGNNIAGSWRLLETLRAEGVGQMVFSSSCSVYGDAGSARMTEDLPIQPVSPYGFSKATVERMLADYGRAYGLRTINLRYFNAAGADPDGELGEVHDPETHLIPVVLAAAAGRQGALKIFGDDYPTPDGTCVRDYIHVADLAEGHVAALRAMLGDGLTGSFNLGTGRGYSIREVVAAAEKITGRRVPVELAPRRAGDPAQAVADASLSARVLKWQPRHSGLEAILESAWRWMQRQGAPAP